MRANIAEAFRIAKLARDAGYAVRVKQGLLQFVIVEYDAQGRSTVRPVTDWVSIAEAAEIVAG